MGALKAAEAEADKKRIARENAVAGLTAFCQRQLKDQMVDLVKDCKTSDDAVSILKKTFEEISVRKVKNNYMEEFEGAVPDEVTKPIMDEFTPAYEKAFTDLQERLRAEAEEAG